MKKSKWLIGLLKGKIGIQSGNKDQRWIYNKERGVFQSINNGEPKDTDIGLLFGSDREYSFVAIEEMTLYAVCEELKREIKIVR